MAARIVYKDKRTSYTLALLSLPAPDHLHVGYTIVFKDGVPEETVLKYMSDVVDADGRITQSYDWFLNVGPSLNFNIPVTGADMHHY
jgi:hypothetical protein